MPTKRQELTVKQHLLVFEGLSALKRRLWPCLLGTQSQTFGRRFSNIKESTRGLAKCIEVVKVVVEVAVIVVQSHFLHRGSLLECRNL